jgi:hypothetical protein
VLAPDLKHGDPHADEYHQPGALARVAPLLEALDFRQGFGRTLSKSRGEASDSRRKEHYSSTGET